MTDKRETAEGEVLLVGAESAGQRLDAYIAARMPPHVSRSRIKEVVKQLGVTVDGQVCDSPNHRLKEGQEIRVIIPEPQDAEPKAEAIALDIAYEDEDLLVVNKPAGMVVHPAVGNWKGTLVNALLHHCGDSLSGIGGVKRPGIVHRLDKETSGLIVVAKNEFTHAGLSDQFRDHGRNGPLERKYLALVWEEPAPRKGKIETFLARSSSNPKKRAVVPESRNDAKIAITNYLVTRVFNPTDGDTPISLVECSLETGRTHQIRVHMSHLGHPLIGDPEYGSHFRTKINKLPERLQEVISKFRRQALHAAVLGFEHPRKKINLRFESPLPEDFARILSACEQSDKTR